ncbi:MAG: glutamate racemase [Muribaculaceae bacterium]|nr:glutamate racemase [Muribaculaceae bacterium]
MGSAHPIGVFDSGYGGLTILREIHRRLPDYDYLYLGDNARNPYGVRSMETVYRFTLQAVNTLFERGCNLVVLACNTASAKALRSIQQNDLPAIWQGEGRDLKRVLGVIIPSVEAMGEFSVNGHIGILATQGTVASRSYQLEAAKYHPDFKVTAEACPMWVPLVEYGEAGSDGADFFVSRHINSLLERDTDIDTILLGCTHYPLLLDKILKYVPRGIRVVAQGAIVADSLADYLTRHPELERECSKGGSMEFLTTESPEIFSEAAATFLGMPVEASQISL